MTTTAPTRPLWRHHGGKFGQGGRTAKWIVSHFPRHRVYVEPFGGAGSALLQKERSASEVYNDLDGAIVGVLRVLATPYMADALRLRLEATPYARAEFEYAQDYLRANRTTGFVMRDPVEHAALVLTASMQGHGSAGLRGKTSTGFRAAESQGRILASSDWANYPAHIERFKARLAGVMIESRPWQSIVDRYDSADTLIYFDPPYLRDVRTTNSRSDGYVCDMDDEGSHRELAEWCVSADSMIAVSHYDHALYRELYDAAGWQRSALGVGVDSGARRTEMLWINEAAQKALDRQGSLFGGGAS